MLATFLFPVLDQWPVLEVKTPRKWLVLLLNVLGWPDLFLLTILTILIVWLSVSVSVWPWLLGYNPNRHLRDLGHFNVQSFNGLLVGPRETQSVRPHIVCVNGDWIVYVSSWPLKAPLTEACMERLHICLIGTVHLSLLFETRTQKDLLCRLPASSSQMK